MNIPEMIVISLGVVTAYIITIFGGALFVWLCLKVLNFTPDLSEDLPKSDQGIPRAGLMIGMVERAIILTFGLLNQFGAISFVFVAKSMARFKQLEKRHFAEYYLVGTLLSFFFALAVAVVFQVIYSVYIVDN
jgi:hypothetical protein